MAELSAFWDKMSDRYAAQPIANEAAYKAKLERTRAHLQPDMTLFEFGCGTGGTALAHAPFVRHIRAIDFSEPMLEKARRRARETGITNVSFERGDITTEPMPETPYDMVLGLSILHLLKDNQAVIDKVYAMLRPGGLFVSSTACVGDSLKILGLIAPLGQALGLLPQLNVMSRTQLLARITRSGFRIEEEWQPDPKAAVFVIARKPL